MKFGQLMIAACLMGTATAAAAQSTTVRGSAAIYARARSVSTLALGSYSVAGANVGSLTNSRVGGASITAQGGNQVLIAAAPYSRVRSYVGAVNGANYSGTVSANGSTRNVIGLGLRPGSNLCVAVGSVGPGGRSAAGSTGTVIVYDIGFWRRTRVRIGNSGQVC